MIIKINYNLGLQQRHNLHIVVNHYQNQLENYKRNEVDLLLNVGYANYRIDEESFIGIEDVALKRCAIFEIANDIITHRMQECGIIYCSTKSDCNKLVDVLNYMGVHCGLYYSDVDLHRNYNYKTHALNDWMRGAVNIMVCTSAFGLGTNKANVRFVKIYGVPNDIAEFYQQFGRGGRDQLPTDCTLYYNYIDFVK